jgi:anti-sigma regulatory factor (Ser/Thr protein kinase)
VHQLDLPASATSARAARAFLAEYCRAEDLPDEVCDAALLLVSELTGNAFLHARSGARVRVQHADRVLRVEVADDSPELPRLRPTSVDGTGGRGVRILDALAARWGVTVRSEPPPGKAVWFVLPLA